MEALELVQLSEYAARKPAELSGGQQQRVAVARALLPRPDVVFADEPTGNLDSRSGAEVLDLLRSSVRETGQTVVMVTHDPVAASYASSPEICVVPVAEGPNGSATAASVRRAMRSEPSIKTTCGLVSVTLTGPSAASALSKALANPIEAGHEQSAQPG